MPIQAEKSLYDLAVWCRQHPALDEYLVQTPTETLIGMLHNRRVPSELGELWEGWQERFQTHLDIYGHAVYDLDFAKPIPADDPSALLTTLKMYLNDQGTNPYKRQAKQLECREQAAQDIQTRLKGLRLKWFQKLLGWAQKYVPMREDNLADIGLGYPLLRRMLRELGKQLVNAGVLEHYDDIFWLYESEVENILEDIYSGQKLFDTSMFEAVQQRKMAWQAARQLTPPVMLPERSGLMKIMERFLPTVNAQEGNVLSGVGASPGRVTLPACVLHGPEDFSRMVPGSALVAAITTPAWTPLFAMASAVVTDVGGLMSHGSIVAREYGIPAVLGTGVATNRIQSGQIITVDGDAGTVTLLDISDPDNDR
jgi:pyruvate,water dikinase